ncbi:hypothetical protein [Saccharopolyspora hattusasensis]|uniref:hypothetical protein n=1 Tax=Saccharopolyspora hattusasensis TaxID=1128679 RepID=UPI003D97D095
MSELNEKDDVAWKLALSKFATKRSEVKIHVLLGGVVHLFDRGEHVMSITPKDFGVEYEGRRSKEIEAFEAFKAARNASVVDEPQAGDGMIAP